MAKPFIIRHYIKMQGTGFKMRVRSKFQHQPLTRLDVHNARAGQKEKEETICPAREQRSERKSRAAYRAKLE